MLDTENHLDNGDNVSEEPIEFQLGGHAIHPADDSMAMWDLLIIHQKHPFILLFNKFVIK